MYIKCQWFGVFVSNKYLDYTNYYDNDFESVTTYEFGHKTIHDIIWMDKKSSFLNTCSLIPLINRAC